jgi:hypothetical protein
VKIVGARRTVALGAWLVMTSVVVSPAWGEPLSLLAITTINFDASRSPRPTDAGPDARELGAGRSVAPPPITWLSLTGSVSDAESVDLQALLERGEQWRLVHLGAVASSRPLNARMTVFGEIPYLADDPLGVVPGPGDTYEPASLGAKAEAAGFEVGAVYRSVGMRPERFVRAAYRVNRRGPEVWVARRTGPVRVRVSQSRLWDNVDRDPALPRTTEQQTAVTAELAVPSLPFIGLSYMTGDTERESLGPEVLPDGDDRHTVDRVSGLMAYGGERWHLVASSSFSQTRDTVRPDHETVMTSYAFSLSLRPIDALVVVPAVSFGETREKWSAVRGDTGAGSLGLAYAPSQSRWFASTMVNYTTSRTSDGAVDGRAVGITGALGCRLGPRSRTPSTLSLETGYGRYLDAVSPANSSTTVWVSVRLKLAAF